MLLTVILARTFSHDYTFFLESRFDNKIAKITKPCPPPMYGFLPQTRMPQVLLLNHAIVLQSTFSAAAISQLIYSGLGGFLKANLCKPFCFDYYNWPQIQYSNVCRNVVLRFHVDRRGVTKPCFKIII